MILLSKVFENFFLFLLNSGLRKARVYMNACMCMCRRKNNRGIVATPTLMHTFEDIKSAFACRQWMYSENNGRNRQYDRHFVHDVASQSPFVGIHKHIYVSQDKFLFANTKRWQSGGGGSQPKATERKRGKEIEKEKQLLLPLLLSLCMAFLLC